MTSDYLSKSYNLIIRKAFIKFLGGSDGKEPAHNGRNLGLIPGLGRCPGGEHGNPLQYSCLKNPHGWRSLAGYSPWGFRVGHDCVTKHSTANIYICMYVCTYVYPGGGHGDPFQYSCLENTHGRRA